MKNGAYFLALCLMVMSIVFIAILTGDIKRKPIKMKIDTVETVTGHDTLFIRHDTALLGQAD